jgi:quinoprotein glucose dehydrogenase
MQPLSRRSMLYGSAAVMTAATLPQVADAQRSPNGAGATANAYPAPPANGAVTQDTSWTAYAGDARANRYSPLAQINATNFNNLQVAWRFDAARFGPRIETNWESTPLLIKGRLYVTAGARKDVICLDAITGELIWMHREDEGDRGRASVRALSGRGCSYFTDGKIERIIYVTQGYRMKSLDIATGIPDPKFGKAGVVDLKLENDQKIDLIGGDIALQATPLVCNNVIVVGAAHSGAVPREAASTTGNVRGYDARTGKRLWIFHTIPHKGEFGYDSWVVEGQGQLTGHAGVWGDMCADAELNTVYFGVELPVGDYLGMHRKGPGLFGESLVALDLKTGKRKWHYQMVHHGLWDSDVPCSAMIVDLPVNGRTVKAIAQPTKQSFLYVLNRETGEPIWPIPEVAVKPGDVPDEWYSPTQPIPSKPPAYDRQNVGDDDLVDFTPAIKARAMEIANHYARGEGVFQAPVFGTYEGKWGTLVLPGSQGGTNWPGGAFDPETKIAYVYSKTQVNVLAVRRADNSFGYTNGSPPAPGQAGRGQVFGEGEGPGFGGGAPVGAAAAGRGAGGPPPGGPGGPGGAPPGGGRGGGGRGGAGTTDLTGPIMPGQVAVAGLPIVKPPYGRITALDLKDGSMAWQVAHGETPDNIKNHPLLKGLNIPRTGQTGIVGPLVTKTLVICGDPNNTTDAQGVNSSWLRAYDKATGKEVGQVRMTQGQTGTPMTYAVGGWQYIVLAIAPNGTGGSEMIAYRLRAV